MDTVFRVFLTALFSLCLVNCGSSDSSDNNGTAPMLGGGTIAPMTPMGGAVNMPGPMPMGGMPSMAPPPVKTLQVSTTTFNIPPLDAGRSHESSITISNTGNTRVSITEITMTNVTGGQAELLYNPTKLTGITRDGKDQFRYPLPVDTDTPLELHVYFTKSGADTPGGTITVTGDFEGSPLTLSIAGVEGLGTLTVQPAEIDFGRVRPLNESFKTLTGLTGEKTEKITLSNAGQMILNIKKIELIKGGSGAEALDFSLAINGVDPIADESAYTDPDGDGTPGLNPGATIELSVRYAPTKEGADSGRIVIDSDDPSSPETIIQLKGNQAQGCIEVSPSVLVTAGQLRQTTMTEPFTISNCGNETLILDFVGFAAGTDGDLFQLNSPVDMFPAELQPDADPLTLTADYSPRIGTISIANVLIMSNDPDPQKNLIIVKISGETPCMTDDDCDAATMQVCGDDNRCITPQMMMMP